MSKVIWCPKKILNCQANKLCSPTGNSFINRHCQVFNTHLLNDKYFILINKLLLVFKCHSSNVSTTPLRQWGFRQWTRYPILFTIISLSKLKFVEKKGAYLKTQAISIHLTSVLKKRSFWILFDQQLAKNFHQETQYSWAALTMAPFLGDDIRKH